jgi:ribosomal protein S27E
MDSIRCSKCNDEMIPIMFEEEEYDKFFLPTGRTRIACDYLECPSCGNEQTVDGDFLASNWR